MKKLLWIILAVVLSTGIYFTIRYGLRPKPIPILNPTQFGDSEQIGAVIYKRLRQNIRQERLIVLGSMSEVAGSVEIWNGFLKTAAADNVKLDVFFQWPNLALPAMASQLTTVQISESDVQNGELLKQIHQRLQRGHLVVIHALTKETSHLVKDSLTRKLDKLPNNPVLSLSIANYAVSKEGADALSANCTDPVVDDESPQKISCASYKVSRKSLKKKLDPKQLWAAMERHGLKEYLLFVHPPE